MNLFELALYKSQTQKQCIKCKQYKLNNDFHPKTNKCELCWMNGKRIQKIIMENL